jgi:hypothetical protein
MTVCEKADGIYPDSLKVMSKWLLNVSFIIIYTLYATLLSVCTVEADHFPFSSIELCLATTHYGRGSFYYCTGACVCSCQSLSLCFLFHLLFFSRVYTMFVGAQNSCKNSRGPQVAGASPSSTIILLLELSLEQVAGRNETSRDWIFL